MDQRREGRGRMRQTSHPKENRGGGRPHPRTSRKLPEHAIWGSPSHPTRTKPQTRGGGGQQRRQPQTNEGEHTPHQGRQTPGQAGTRTAPTDPSERKSGDHHAHPGDTPQPAKTDHSGHGVTTKQDQRPPQAGQHHPPFPGKGRTTTRGPRTQQRPPASKQSHATDTNGKPRKKGGGVAAAMVTKTGGDKRPPTPPQWRTNPNRP